MSTEAYNSRFTGSEIDNLLQRVKEGNFDDSGSGSGSSVQSDYLQNDPAMPDYIKNRPFYEGKLFTDIIWDGNTEGLTSIPIELFGIPGRIYKVSDTPLTRDQLQNATIRESGAFAGGDMQNVNMYNDIDNDSFCINGMLAFSVMAANDTLSDVYSAMPATVFPEVGVWFLWADSEDLGGIGYTVELLSATKLVKMDPKYLPDNIPGSLPTVNTSDYGKFLRVDGNGNWVAVTIPEWTGGYY